MRKLCVLFFLFFSVLQASTLRLENDSPFSLVALVKAADGTLLSQEKIERYTTKTWDENGVNIGQRKKPSKRSITPFTVVWQCLCGERFSLCEQVATGSVVRATQGMGTKGCKAENKEEK